MIYLACPYSHPDEKIREQRFKKVTQVAAKLIDGGYIIFSPITHSHPIASLHALPMGYEYWKRFDETMIHASGAVWVLKLEGWQESAGIKAEIELALKLHKPVVFINPEDYL